MPILKKQKSVKSMLLEKEQITHQGNRRQEIIKIKAESNSIENRNIVEKSMTPKADSWRRVINL